MPRPLAAITGASSGIGSVFARKLAARGYDLLLIARRRDRLEELGAELSRSYQISAEAFAADLSEPEEIVRAAARIGDDPRLSLLVNNAGFGSRGRFWEAPIDEHIRMHRVHVEAILRLTHAALRSMVRRDTGEIVNVSSVAAFARSRANVNYCATKAWINAFTEGLHLELRAAHSGITVQALCPGFTYSEFHDVLGMDRNVIPHWLWMDAEDVVDASLAGLRDKRLFVIPGWKYRLFVAIFTKLPVGLRLVLEQQSPHTRGRAEEGQHPTGDARAEGSK